MVILREDISSASRKDSGVAASSSLVSLGDDVDLQTFVVPLLLARTAALLVAREAMRAAFACLVGRVLGLSTWARTGGVCLFPGKGISVEGGSSGGGDESAAAVIPATPDDGIAGGRHLSSASFLLSSRRLTLLARSLLLLPDWCTWAAAELPPFALGRNQKETSSVAPSVSSTNLAGMPSLLQRTHAKYWLYALGRGGKEEPTSVLV
jgi:hypothetical protein